MIKRAREEKKQADEDKLAAARAIEAENAPETEATEEEAKQEVMEDTEEP
jgi:hypothetical protein